MITRADVEKTARNNPILNQCITMYEVQQCTWEEAMMTAAVVLTKENKDLLMI